MTITERVPRTRQVPSSCVRVNPGLGLLRSSRQEVKIPCQKPRLTPTSHCKSGTRG